MSLDDQVETQVISPKTEAGRKLVQWAEGLENFSKENVSAEEAITVLGGLAIIGAGVILFAGGIKVPGDNLFLSVEGVGGWSTSNKSILDVAKLLVQQTEGVVVRGDATHWSRVGINISALDRQGLVKELLNLEGFKAFEGGAASTLALAGMGLGLLTGLGGKEPSMKRSTSLLPGVAKAMAGLGKML